MLGAIEEGSKRRAQPVGVELTASGWRAGSATSRLRRRLESVLPKFLRVRGERAPAGGVLNLTLFLFLISYIRVGPIRMFRNWWAIWWAQNFWDFFFLASIGFSRVAFLLIFLFNLILFSDPACALY